MQSKIHIKTFNLCLKKFGNRTYQFFETLIQQGVKLKTVCIQEKKTSSFNVKKKTDFTLHSC